MVGNAFKLILCHEKGCKYFHCQTSTSNNFDASCMQIESSCPGDISQGNWLFAIFSQNFVRCCADAWICILFMAKGSQGSVSFKMTNRSGRVDGWCILLYSFLASLLLEIVQIIC